MAPTAIALRTSLALLALHSLLACDDGPAAGVDAADGPSVDPVDAAVDARLLDALGPHAEAGPPPVESLVFAPAGFARQALALAYVDGAGHVRAYRRAPAGWTAQDVTAASGLPPDVAQVAPLAIVGSGLELAVRRRTGELGWVRDSAGWEHENVTERAAAPLAGAAFAGADFRSGSIFFVADGALHRISNINVNHPTLFPIAGAPAPTGPLGGPFESWIIYAGPGGVPVTLVGDVPNVLTGAPPMVGKGVIGWGAEGQQSIVYRTTGDRLVVGPSAGPVIDLPIAAPAPASDLNWGERRSVPLALAVAYRTASGAAVVLERTSTSTWTAVDLGATAAAPAALGSPVAHYDQNGDLLVGYFGADGHVHLVTRAGTTWTHADLGPSSL
ncbi:MAG: hypothetical protein JNK64_13890 [Myxococcales bacterium]|nr:hypothetical protein [Myxococcales bacterium]